MFSLRELKQTPAATEGKGGGDASELKLDQVNFPFHYQLFKYRLLYHEADIFKLYS